MISEEKLAEIISNKGTAWCVDKYNNPLKLRVIPITLRREFVKLWGEENLFETKEEAEEYLKYGDITRTEKFPYLSWEEFKKCDKSIKFNNGRTQYSMYVFVKNKNTNNCRIIIYADDTEQDWIVFEQPSTRENYYKALDLAVKLFKGEEV